jgi:hypothetical protein
MWRSSRALGLVAHAFDDRLASPPASESVLVIQYHSPYQNYVQFDVDKPNNKPFLCASYSKIFPHFMPPTPQNQDTCVLPVVAMHVAIINQNFCVTSCP